MWAVACAAAAAAVGARERRWGGVVGAEVVLPADSFTSDPARSALAFAADAVDERFARCGWCCSALRMRVAELHNASVQVASLATAGGRPRTMLMRSWDGTEADSEVAVAVVWRLRFSTSTSGGALQPVTAAEQHAAAAFGMIEHSVTLWIDREASATLVRHTWRPTGTAFYSPSTYRQWSERLTSLYGVAAPPVQHKPHATRAPLPLHLVVYNVWNVNNPWPQRLRLLGEIMAAEGPADVVAVQEVRHDNAAPQLGPQDSRHQVSHLDWRLQSPSSLYQVVWEPAMTYLQTDDGLKTQTEGPALFSRLPVRSVETEYLSRFWPEDSGDEHQRLAIAMVVETEQLGSVGVITTHLSLSDSARMQSCYELCLLARRMEAGGAGAVILTGDLNMEPDDPALAFLLGRNAYRNDTCDFRDAWTLPGYRGHELEGAADFDHRGGATFPNLDGLPHKRIDFVLVRGEVSDEAVFSMEVVGARQKQKAALAPSDHLGIRLRLAHQRWTRR